jgi:hypothetical protein
MFSHYNINNKNICLKYRIFLRQFSFGSISKAGLRALTPSNPAIFTLDLPLLAKRVIYHKKDFLSIQLNAIPVSELEN